MFTKCEHTTTQNVAFCRWFPLFTLRTPGTMPPPLSFKTRLGFYASGFPKDARVMKILFVFIFGKPLLSLAFKN